MPVRVNPDERRIALFNQSLRMIQGQNGYRFGIDALLLVAQLIARRFDYGIDLGCGDGILAILLKRLQIIERGLGIELQSSLVDRARRNVELQGQTASLEIQELDLRQHRGSIPPNQFQLAVSNPPYYRAESGQINQAREKALAYHELSCDIGDILDAGKYALKPNGELWLIYPVARLADLFEAARERRLAVSTLRFVHPFADRDANRFVACLKKGRASSPEVLAPLAVYTTPDTYSDEVNALIELIKGGSIDPD